jgi:hypothetical protein
MTQPLPGEEELDDRKGQSSWRRAGFVGWLEKDDCHFDEDVAARVVEACQTSLKIHSIIVKRMKVFD